MAEAQTARQEQTRFDQADRDRIRRALLRYMEENRIGVPTLQKLITATNGINLDYLPLKTLQRFLGDTHRSNDIMVRYCHRFAESLPDEDVLPTVGEALVSFYAGRPDLEAAPLLPPEIAGEYAGRAEPARRRMDLMADGYDHWVPYSTLSITALPHRPFAAAREAVTNWQRVEASSDVPVRRVYEGVLFHPAGALVAVMRNILTGTPRIYWLAPSPPFPLAGHGHESVGTLDERPTVGPGLFRSDTVVFERTAQESRP